MLDEAARVGFKLRRYACTTGDAWQMFCLMLQLVCCRFYTVHRAFRMDCNSNQCLVCGGTTCSFHLSATATALHCLHHVAAVHSANMLNVQLSMPNSSLLLTCTLNDVMGRREGPAQTVEGARGQEVGTSGAAGRVHAASQV